MRLNKTYKRRRLSAGSVATRVRQKSALPGPDVAGSIVGLLSVSGVGGEVGHPIRGGTGLPVQVLSLMQRGRATHG